MQKGGIITDCATEEAGKIFGVVLRCSSRVTPLVTNTLALYSRVLTIVMPYIN